MCRLFGLHAGTPVDAQYWLIDAPDARLPLFATHSLADKHD